MKKVIKWQLGFGFLIWLIPFIASFPIIGLRESNRALFESIMPVILTVTVLVFSTLFFREIKNDYVKQGIFTGILWFFFSIILDLIMFLPDSPMQMTLTDYFADIGLTYLIIIFIPIFIGYLLEKKRK
jgi:hypothetical protein